MSDVNIGLTRQIVFIGLYQRGTPQELLTHLQFMVYLKVQCSSSTLGQG